MTGTGSTSDGFHTFDALYEFRVLLHPCAVRAWLAEGFAVVRSWNHHDGEPCFGGGWFVVVAQLPTGQVSNHYRAGDWALFATVPEARSAPGWDGHTSADVAHRLRVHLTAERPVS